jgi:uncharacterized protein
MGDVDLVLRAFHAVERRDREELLSLYHPEVEFHEAPSLPYGGSVRGKENMAGDESWLETWGPLQPTEAERSMDPRPVAAGDRELVVLYRQRAVAPDGERLDAPVLGLYEVRNGKLARAQMFHFDTAAVLQFLARARS